jgi:putative tryptophan/tyrosine transport system substrate-binding protein
MMDRRRFLLTSLAGALAASRAGEAQQAGRIYKIAIIFTMSPVAEMTETHSPGLGAFLGELRRIGYVEGSNLVIERRSALGKPERFREIADEVVRLNPDVIVVPSTRLAQAVMAATKTIPIVGEVYAPVEKGLAFSLARPGGNFTGVTGDPGPEIHAKWLSLLHESAPQVSRVAFLGLSSSWNTQAGQVLREAAQRLNLTVALSPLDGPFGEAQYVSAFRFMAQNRAQALLLDNLPEHWQNRQIIADLAVRYRLPAISQSAGLAEAGLLMSYGAPLNSFGRLAGYVDRVLKGARPGDLPIGEPTHYKLVINRKTARAIGLTIPASLLTRAGQIIE